MLQLGFNKKLKKVWGNDREITLLNQEIMQKKPVLKKLWTSWYQEALSFIKLDGPTVEIGTGGGFFKEFFPQAITSDILHIPGIDLVFNALEMPFKDRSIRTIVLTGVLHHIHKPFVFFKECERVLKEGGRIIINDPYVSPFSYVIFKWVHFENCDYSNQLEFEKGQPLMDCNLALTTIIFKKRLSDFKNAFPRLQVIHTDCNTFFIYMLSGGFSYPALIPSELFNMFMWLEKALRPLRKALASNFFIVIEKKERGVSRSLG